MRFDYWTVQATPDPLLLHSFGIGVIVANAETGQARCQFLTRDQIPATESNAAASIMSSAAYLKDLAADYSTYADSLQFNRRDTIRSRINLLTRDWANMVTIDHMRSIDAASLEAATTELFHLFIRAASEAAHQRPITLLKNRIRTTYENHTRINQHLQLGAELSTAASKDKLDLAVAAASDGLFELNTSMNFNRSSLTQVKDRIDAWGHRIFALRDNGGLLLHNDTTLEIPPEASFLITYVPPETPGQKELFSHAMQVWEELNVQAITESEIEAHATELEAQLSA